MWTCDQFDDAALALADGMLACLVPSPHLTVSEIAERHLILSPEYSKVTGPINLDLYPYLRQPMDDLTPGTAARVVALMAGVQMGKSVIGQAFLVSRIGCYPGPFLWVTSHDTKAEEFSKNRLDLMIRDSALLRSKVMASDGGRDKNNTIKLKRFTGGTVKLVGAQSVSGLTSDTIRDVMIDEADDHRENVSSAGSSTELAMNRQTTFGELAKTLIVSSPKVKGQSEIESWVKRGTMRRFMVPCPHCGHMQSLEPCDDDLKNWRLKWTRGDYSDVHYECVECAGHWHNVDKSRFLAGGRWSDPTNAAADGSIESYLLNFMYMPLGTFSWADFARQWDAAVDRMKAGDLDPMRTLVNTRMARPFEDRGEALDAHELQTHVEPDWEFVPADVQMITAATDVQGGEQGRARLESMWIGWAADGEGYLLDYVVTPGAATDDETWAAHDQLLGKVFEFADGRRGAAATWFVDRGFSATEVLQYTMRRTRQKVYAIKGVDGTPADPIIAAVAQRANLRKIKNAPYYVVKTIAATDAADRMLRAKEPGPNFLHIPESLLEKIPNLLDMLTAEQRFKVRGKDGKVRVHWTKKSEAAPNEALDLLKYNIAAKKFIELSGFQFKRAERVAVTPSPVSAAESAAILRKISQSVQTPLHSTVRPARKKRPAFDWSRGV